MGMHGEARNLYKILVGKSEAKRLIWRPVGSWKDNIKMNLK
jgi:hypothetical protein